MQITTLIENDGYVHDSFAHELVLALREENGVAVFYQARGFRLVGETTGPPNVPRESALFAQSQAS